jgi:uncharacterized protein YggE
MAEVTEYRNETRGPNPSMRESPMRQSGDGQPRARLRRQNQCRLQKGRSVTRLFIFLFMLIPLGAAAQQPSVPAEPQVVTTGVGVVQATPDRAWITIGAESRASSAKEAQRLNTEAMTPIQQKLRAAGVPADAIKTVGYDVQYEWDYNNGKRVGRGYVARNTIEVRVDAIDRVGDLLEIAGTSGATTLGGIRFDFKDRTRLEREALRLAVADARAKAEVMASGAGRAIDRVLRIEEGSISGGPIPRPMFREVAAQGAAIAAPPPIESGETELRAQVTLTAILK